MTETIKTWRAEPLTWGRGPRQFEMFLAYAGVVERKSRRH
jgi:hypothetical protein